MREFLRPYSGHDFAKASPSKAYDSFTPDLHNNIKKQSRGIRNDLSVTSWTATAFDINANVNLMKPGANIKKIHLTFGREMVTIKTQNF